MGIQIKSKKVVQSVALPGVSFVVRRMSQIRRAARDLETIEASVRISSLLREWREIMDGDKPARDLSTADLIVARSQELAPDQRSRIASIDRECSLLMDRFIRPASIRAALVSIDGISDDEGALVVDAEALLAIATPELDGLIAEIYEACEAASGLDAEETKNLPLPTTTDEPATASGLTA